MSSTRIVGWDLPKTSLGVPKFDMSNAADIGGGGPLKALSNISNPATEQFVKCKTDGALITQKFSSSRGSVEQGGVDLATWNAGAVTDNIDLDALGVNNINIYIYATGLLASDSGPVDAFGVDGGSYYFLEQVQKAQSGGAFYWKINLKNIPFRYIALANASSKTLTVDIAAYLGY